MKPSAILGFAVGPVGAAVMGSVIVPVSAWLFSAEDIGRASMLLVASNFAVIIFSLGLDQGYVREFHELGPDQHPRLLRTAALPGLLLLLGASLATFLLAPTAPSRTLFDIDDAHISGVVIMVVIAGLVSRFLSLILRMQEKGFAFSMSQVASRLLLLVLFVGCALFSLPANFNLLIHANAASLLLVPIIFGWKTRASWIPALRVVVDGVLLRQMLRFGLPLVLSGFATWALMAMDRLFLRSLSTYAELGIYSVAASAAAVAGVPANIFNTVWAPTIYKWSKEGVSTDRLDELSEHVLAAIIAVVALGGTFSWLLRFVLPAQYLSVQYLVIATMLAPLFLAASETTAVGLGLARRSTLSMGASIAAALAAALLNFWLVPPLGAAGAAIAAASSMWFFLVARTELACLAWRPLPRVKLYTVTSGALGLAIAFACTGAEHGLVWALAWASFGVAGALMFRRSSSLALLQLRRGMARLGLSTSADEAGRD